MKKILLLLLAMNAHVLSAQINDAWIFGSHAQLNFSSGTADTSYNSTINNLEGTASVCDYNGNLLFYATADKCYDKNGTLMPNGNGLGGTFSSTTVAILQKPGDCSKYYLFTTQDHTGTGKLYYSEIDMCLNNGNGDVVSGVKKIQMQSNCSEKIVLVKNTNQTDVWLITHELGNNNYVVYSITTAGVGATPQSYNVGTSFQTDDNAGYIKANASGTKLAVAVLWGNICEVVSFDPSSGIVSGTATNYGTIITNNTNGEWYGLEFSPNEKYLYAARCDFSNPASLYQINLIDNTYTLLSTESAPIQYYYGALRLAPDGKIYMAKNTSHYLGVINDPDSLGAACNYVNDGLLLATNSKSEFGLPTATVPVPQGSNSGIISLGNDTSTCSPFTIDLTAQCDQNFLWQDGSTLNTYTISSSGTYYVTASSPTCGVSSDTLHVTSSLQAFITGTDSICIGDSVTLTASTGNSFLWSSGSTSQSIVVAPLESTVYSVSVTDSACSGTAVFNVSVILPPKIYFSFADDTVCLDASPIPLTSGFPSGGTYTGDGVVGNIFYPSIAGAGVHEVTYTYTDVCTSFIQQEIVVVVCTGIQSEGFSQATISVFPNPFSDEFIVESSSLLQHATISLDDAMGKLITDVHFSLLNRNRILFSCSSLAAGVYWITVKDKDVSVKFKIVKL